MARHTSMAQGNDPNVRNTIERSVGILHFVSPKEHSWNGTIRKRYTDFQVHEIDKNGTVLHLDDFSVNAREYERKQQAEKAPRHQEEAPKSSSVAPESTESQATDEQALTTASTAPAKATGPSSEDLGPTAVSGSDETQTTNQHDDAKVDEPKEAEAPEDQISKEDSTILVKLLGQGTVEELLAFYDKVRKEPKMKAKSHGSIKFPAITDRSLRSRIHSEIRRIFSGKIDTSTDSDGIISAMAAGGGPRRWGNHSNERGRGDRQDQGRVKIGKYLHFSLYKENRDTMEAIGHIARALNIKPAFFGIAGTKDRRAVTVQRVSLRGRDPVKLLFLNNRIPGVKIGDFKFDEKDVYLGCHRGNEFSIVLKDCTFDGTQNESFERRLEIAQSTVDSALASIDRNGFINYFGTQRFGTFEIGTHAIGIKILKEDFKGAVNDLLSFDSALCSIDTSTYRPGDYIRHDDISRAKAMLKFRETGDVREALKILPRRCNTEFAILKHLEKQSHDYVGALLSISRNMRNMYIHAYQSFVWNFVASRRWELFGTQIVKGDLVIVKAGKTAATGTRTESDEIDEDTIHLSGIDRDGNDQQEDVRILSAEDVQSGRFTISDVVLPTPGCDIVYPENEIGQYYADFMAKEEHGALNPNDMQRRQRDFTLSGTYRKLMGSFIGHPVGSVRTYTHDHDQLIPTDLDIIRSRQTKEDAERNTTHQQQNLQWHAFANKVGENERQEARAAVERRKAEGSSELAEPRLNETWVETSAGGSKRVKVASQSMELDKKSTTNGTAPAGDAMDVDSPKPTAPAGPAIVGPDAMTTTSAFDNTGQIIEKTTDSISKEDSTSGATAAQVVAASDSAAQMTSDGTTPEPKIAVILKFALNPSGYATMVLRELQG